MATNGKRQENMERRLDHNLTHECEWNTITTTTSKHLESRPLSSQGEIFGILCPGSVIVHEVRAHMRGLEMLHFEEKYPSTKHRKSSPKIQSNRIQLALLDPHPFNPLRFYTLRPVHRAFSPLRPESNLLAASICRCIAAALSFVGNAASAGNVWPQPLKRKVARIRLDEGTISKHLGVKSVFSLAEYT